jgi:hypothetical protein
MSREIEISFSKRTGEIRFTRGDTEYNAMSKDILYEIVDKESRKELDAFFADSEQIEVILGDEILCG